MDSSTSSFRRHLAARLMTFSPFVRPASMANARDRAAAPLGAPQGSRSLNLHRPEHLPLAEGIVEKESTRAEPGQREQDEAQSLDGDGPRLAESVIEHGAAGRPFVVGSYVRLAQPRRVARGEGGWGAAERMRPNTAALSPALREKLAAAWTRDGLLEHASVASFGRFALELLAAGAPAKLVDMAHRAALDEVRHARLCFSLASAYAGEDLTPAPFPFRGKVDVNDDLASIAARVVKEGCIGETIATVQAAEQLFRAKDPAVREVLTIIAVDEARHAELAFRAVAWAIAKGGEAVRLSARAAFEEAFSVGTPASCGSFDEALAAHGQLVGDGLTVLRARAATEVVRPSALALLGETQATKPSARG